MKTTNIQIPLNSEQYAEGFMSVLVELNLFSKEKFRKVRSVLQKAPNISKGTFEDFSAGCEAARKAHDPERQPKPPIPLAQLFAPFQKWNDDDTMFGLSVQDGQITTNPAEDREWTEYHIVGYGGGIFEIEISATYKLCVVVYRGSIPSKRFLCELLANLEYPISLPLS